MDVPRTPLVELANVVSREADRPAPGRSPTLTWETERWAEALAVHRLHGDAAHAHIGERIRDLESKNAPAGVKRWREIAARLDLIRAPGAST